MAEKERNSGEIVREQEPVLPTVNPEAQKSASKGFEIPSAVYVWLVEAPCHIAHTLNR